MRPDARDRLYFALGRRYRRRATQAQIVLVLVAMALSAASMAAHYYLVFRPSQVDFALASMPYEPWYLAQEEAAPATESKTPAAGSEAVVGQASLPPAAMPTHSVEPARPNLIPLSGASYSPAELAGKIEAYLENKGAGALKQDLAASAQEMADAYASSSGAGTSNSPFPAGLERSVLEQGRLWDLRDGCEPEIYLKFPPGQLDALGCGLADVPAGKPLGVGVAMVEKVTGPTSVIAVVWESK